MTLPIYLDNQATTPCDPRVVEKMLPYFTAEFGNSSSVSHVFGQRAQKAVVEAQKHVSALIGADDPKSIFFTSGATESNNIAIKSIMFGYGETGHLITTATEHKAILDPAEFVASKGYDVDVLPVNEFGQVSPDLVSRSTNELTRVVSAIYANNETGSLNDVTSIAKICGERNMLFHTDATQAAGRVEINCAKQGIDLLSLSGHKLYGPKGIGALYCRKRARGIKLEPLQHGGGHQNKVRSGTLPVALIVGLGEACRLAKLEFDKDRSAAKMLSDLLKNKLGQEFESIRFNGHETERIDNNIHLTIPGINSEALIHKLKDSVAISTGAACTTAAPEPSHVLLAMGLDKNSINSSVRIGTGRFTTTGDLQSAAEEIIRAAQSLVKIGAITR